MSHSDILLPAVAGDSTRQTWAGLLRQAHARHADRPAVLTETGAWSYAQLLQAAGRVAAFLSRVGVRPGARVILALENRPEVVAIERALALWGWVRVALGSRLHPREIEYIAADCGAAVVFCETVVAAQLRSGAVLVSAEPCAAAPHTLAEALAGAGQPPPMPSVAAGDVCSLMYTSGTTGRPKGAMNSQRAWHAMVTHLARVMPSAGPGDVLLHAAPMSHFSGSVSAAYLAGGAAVATLRHFDPREAAGHIVRTGATCMPLVPTMLNDLVRALDAPGALPWPGLRVLPYGGSSIAPRALAYARERLGRCLLQMYGSSEALIPVTSLSIAEHEPGPDQLQRLASAGTPYPGIEVRLTEVDAGVGEICVRGANVMTGYWGKPQETTRVLDAAGWYATGDLGAADAQGRIRIVDRRRDMLISGGFNIYPAEIERVIADMPGVAEVAVIGVPHPRWGESVKAFVVLAPGARVTGPDVVAACLAQLASYKKPLAVDIVETLPKTSTGKLDKRRIREQEAVRREAAGPEGVA